MSNALLRETIAGFSLGRELPAAKAEDVLDSLIFELDNAILAEVLIAWHEKGMEENEIFEIARVMRGRMKRINSRYDRFVDIVGTGGSKAKTFNVSTAASFVVAGAGLPVAKHGNKAATSNSGSADVLSQLGIDPAVDATTAERCLNEQGICFMFAPNYHRLSPTLAKVRRDLGFPTIFNCVGPLCNPASAPYQLLGVWDRSLVTKMANALRRLGTKRAWIVYGESGLDEIALDGVSHIAEVEGTEIRHFDINAGYFGFDPSATECLRSNDPAHSASMIRNTLLGHPHVPAAQNIVLLNAAAALYIAGAARDPLVAGELATESLRTGQAMRKLIQLSEAAPV